MFDFFSLQTPVVVDPDGLNEFDLLISNEHIHHSEVRPPSTYTVS